MTSLWQTLLSAVGMLFFAELSAECFRRITPLLEIISQRTTKSKVTFNRLSLLFRAISISTPLLTFAMAAAFYAKNTTMASGLIIGTTIGCNMIILAIVFAFILLSGPIKFFRLRTINSPLFLLFAMLLFALTTLNSVIRPIEGLLLLLLAATYIIYIRKFSTEVNYQKRKLRIYLLENEINSITAITVFCMAFGFFVLSILSSYPLFQWLNNQQLEQFIGIEKFTVHFLALLLLSPWIFRVLISLFNSSTQRAFLTTNLTHACLFNLLVLPGVMALITPLQVTAKLIRYDLPVLLLITIVFICTLLIEKEKGRFFPWLLLGSYLIYSLVGLLS